MNRLLVILLMFGLTMPAIAAHETKLDATYSITRVGEPIGKVTESLSIAKGQYQLESTTIAIGVLAIFVKDVIKKTSSGLYDSHGYRPQQYSYKRSTKPQKDLDAHFDWRKKTATFNFDGKTESQALPEQMQDLLSLGYQLRFWPKTQNSLQLPVSNGKKITVYDLTRVGKETVTVPAGTFHTTRYTRERTPDHDGITVWVSDKLAAPVKIVIVEKKGAETDQVLTRVMGE